MPQEAMKKLETASDVTLTRDEAKALKERMAELEELADAGKAYIQKLRGDVMKYAALSGAGIDAGILEKVTARMDIGELTAFSKAFAQKANASVPARPQLAVSAEQPQDPFNSQFRI